MPALKGEEVAPEHGNHTPKWKKAAPKEAKLAPKLMKAAHIEVEIRSKKKSDFFSL